MSAPATSLKRIVGPADTFTETDERDTMRHYLKDPGVRSSIVAGIGIGIGAAYVAAPSPYIAGVGVLRAAVATWSAFEARRTPA